MLSKKIEEKIIGDNFQLINGIESNQTAQLKDKYGDLLTTKVLNIIEKVQISTPEFINCNSFMYEPLIDIEGGYLLDLYKEIKGLKENEIWK